MRTILSLASLAALTATAAAAPLDDPARLVTPETARAVADALVPVEEALRVEVRIATHKGDPAVSADRRLAALTDLAQKLADRPARDNNDVLQLLICPEWQLVAVAAAPEAFALKLTPGHRDAIRKHFARLFADPNKELPLAADAACRDLVALYHPGLTIRDNARLFSPAALHKAARLLEDFKGPFEVKLVIETASALADLDADLASKVGTLPRPRLEASLAELAKGRADALRLQGLIHHAVYVLILDEPASVTVVNWPQVFPGSFSDTKRNRLREELRRQRDEPADAALFRGVKLFTAFQESMRPLVSPLPTLSALALLGALTGAWLVLRVVRRRVAGPDRPRLYTPALMGSLFGVPTGGWVYDQLFEAERPAAPAAVAALPDLLEPEPEPPPEEPQDPGAGEPP